MSCKKCAIGTASTETRRKTECPTCAIGRGPETSGNTECSACGAGKYGIATSMCTNCPSGWAQPNQKQDQCVQCGTKESPNYEDLPVLKGESTDERTGSASCSLCDLGKYGPTSFPGTCVDCPVGTYEDGKGGLEDALTGAICKPCPIDTWSDKTGKSSGADCQSCPDRTTTGGSVGNVEDTACVCAAGHYKSMGNSDDDESGSTLINCVVCEEFKTNCSENAVGLTLSTVPAALGFFRSKNDSTKFERCDNEQDCPGGLIKKQCRHGHTGVLCAVCYPGYIRIEGECTECSAEYSTTDGSTGILLASTVPPGLFFLLLVLYFCRKDNEGDEDTLTTMEIKNWKSTTAPTKITPQLLHKEKDTANALALEKDYQNANAKSDDGNKGDKDSDTIAETIEGEITERIEEDVDETVAEATGDTVGDEIEVDGEGALDNGTYVSIKDLGDTVGDSLGGLNVASKQFKSMGHRMRIIIGYVQITSALVFSFDIPWPPMTLDILKSLTFINFNFMDFFAPLDPCLLHTPFLRQAAFHMAILPLCAVIILLASIVAMIRNKASTVISKAKSTLVTLVFFLYPGLVTRIFVTFKCRTIGGKPYLVADYSQVCYEGEHAVMVTVMVVCMFVYVLGIPLISTLVLYCNKKLMSIPADVDDPQLLLRGEKFSKVFGALYDAYEPRFWWFEAVIMIQKALLTGGLVLVAPGSSAQVLVGLVIALGFLIVLMQTKPYIERGEDVLQTITTVSTVAMLLIGFTLKVDRGNVGEGKGEYDDQFIDFILVALFSGVGVSGLWMVVTSLPCFAGLARVVVAATTKTNR